MLDGLLGRSGFSSKCKSLIKPTRTRIEVLRRRAEAQQRFLKEDLAKLLANGLDVNAYGRTEEFIGGLNLLCCYTFIDQSCEFILKQLSIMQKLGQCPEECRETVASLMFAAARFSELPELRDLRDVLQDRYGNGLECYVNQVFVEKIASKGPVVEKRIKLLQDIAAEFSIQWDSNGFKQRMDRPSTLPQDQAKKPVSLCSPDKLPNGYNVVQKINQRFKERIEHAQEGPTLHNDGYENIRKKEVLHHYGNGNGNDRKKEELNIPFARREEKHSKVRKEQVLHHYGNGNEHGNGNDTRKEELNIPFVRRQEKPSTERIQYDHNGNGNGIPFVGRDEKRGYKHEELTNKVENRGYISKSRQESDSEKKRFEKKDTPVMMKNLSSYDDDDSSSSVNRERKEKHNYKQDLIITNKEKTIENNDNLLFGRREMKSSRRSRDRRPKPDLLYYGKSQGISKDENKEEEDDDIKSTGKVREEEPVRSKSSLPPPYVKLNIPPPYSKPHNASESGLDNYQNNIPLPKPRSVRRKHSKSSSSYDDIASSEDGPRVVKRVSSSRRKERKGLQILSDDQHYHNHRGDDEEKMMDKLLLHYSSKKPSNYDINKLRKKKSESTEEMIVPPTRSLSLPNEHSGESEPKKKVYTRANSFQPDNQAPHVHPKLPDYDDLAARFAALRGR